MADTLPRTAGDMAADRLAGKVERTSYDASASIDGRALGCCSSAKRVWDCDICPHGTAVWAEEVGDAK